MQMVDAVELFHASKLCIFFAFYNYNICSAYTSFASFCIFPKINLFDEEANLWDTPKITIPLWNLWYCKSVNVIMEIIVCEELLIMGKESLQMID